MNWIERMYEIKARDLYSQNGEGLLLEYIWNSLINQGYSMCGRCMFDIGSGDKFILSNSRHLRIAFKSLKVLFFEKENGTEINIDNCTDPSATYPNIISIDIDGNDYWILEKMLPHYKPEIVIAEFNPAFTDARAIKYNPDHVWAGDDYYGFSFEAGIKLAERFGYKVIFQVADMNMFMVRADLVDGLYIPPVTFKQNDFFQKSNRTDWVIL
jgi:hypothetical protein